jgi:hypothetical protein
VEEQLQYGIIFIKLRKKQLKGPGREEEEEEEEEGGGEGGGEEEEEEEEFNFVFLTDKYTDGQVTL